MDPSGVHAGLPIPWAELRWRCDPRSVPSPNPALGRRVPGQALAASALRFALACGATGQNAFVRGSVETGGMDLVLDALDEMDLTKPKRPDRCYVRNFTDPSRPRLVTVEGGRGPELRGRVRAMIERIGSAPAEGGAATALDDAGRAALQELAAAIRADFPEPVAYAVRRREGSPSLDVFLEELLAASRTSSGLRDARRAWEPNVVLAGGADDRAAVFERAPSAVNLCGAAGVALADSPDGHHAVTAGALLRADGGVLVIRARELVVDPTAWSALARAMRDGVVEPSPSGWPGPPLHVPLRPEPAAVCVRVVLVGDHRDYGALADVGPEFEHLFKVIADLDDTIPRDLEGVRTYARLIDRLAADEALPSFDRDAVAALVEHGARIASSAGRLSARIHRVNDLAREAAFLCGQAGRGSTLRADVEAAVVRTKLRGSRDAHRFQEYVADGSLLVRVSGEVTGQVNSLAVIDTGPLTYGFPARITASVGAGGGGIVDIQGRSALSGAVHDKSFQILEGLVRRLLLRDRPLAFTASLAFEQNYGRIDGDSATAAEVCCLLSALVDVPIRQGLAISGSVDQLGHVQAVGSINEKIEGFFDACVTLGLDGTQGVLVPTTNARDLMLRQDVVDACAAERFRVVPIACIHDALELLMAMPAGRPDEWGRYPEGTLMHRAGLRAEQYAELQRGSARRSPPPLAATPPGRDPTPSDALA